MTKVTVEKQKLEELQKKAAVLEEILGLIEDQYLGQAMAETEIEDNIPLADAKVALR